jgi:hypothetical protein
METKPEQSVRYFGGRHPLAAEVNPGKHFAWLYGTVPPPLAVIHVSARTRACPGSTAGIAAASDLATLEEAGSLVSPALSQNGRASPAGVAIGVAPATE